jgi:beta-glucanase (GH16 family)
MGQLVSDNFTRANENPLANSNWGTITGYGNCQIVSNVAEASVLATNSNQCWTNVSINNDQYAEVTISNYAGSNPQSFGPGIRMGTGGTGYIVAMNIGAGTGFTIYKLTGSGGYTSLGTGGGTTNNGDVIRLQASGTSLSVYRNGIIIKTITDSTYSSGFPGFYAYAGTTLSNVQISLFAAGNTPIASITGNCGVGGATVSYSGTASGSVKADVQGNFTISDLANGSYTITPSKSAYSFSPASSSQSFSGTLVSGVNFTYGYTNGLDINAWYIPEECMLNGLSGNPYADSPGCGILASEVDVNSAGNSYLQLHIDPGPYTFVGCYGGTGGSLPLKAGMVMWKKMQMQYGTVEVKAKLTGVNVHPTIWMMGTQSQQTCYFNNTNAPNWPIGTNEIDIMEGEPGPSGPMTTGHYATHTQSGGAGATGSSSISDYSTNWHTYKIVWTSTALTWYVDGVQQFQTTTVANIPQQRMFLMLDLECADTLSGDIVLGNFPQVAQYDYVKAWDQSNNLIFYDEFDGNGAQQNLSQTDLTLTSAKGSIGSATSVSGTLTTCSPGSLFLVFLRYQNTTQTATMSDTALNTWQKVGSDSSNGTYTFQFWVARNTANGSVTIGANYPSSSAGDMVFAEYAGVDPAGIPWTSALSAVDAYAAVPTVATTTTPTSSSITASYSNDMLFTFGLTSQAGSCTAGSGWTMEVNNASLALCIMQDKIVVNSGSYSGTWTQPSSNAYATIAAVKSLASQIPVPAATPTFSLAGTTLTILTSTFGASIYYTTDGSTPTTGSTLYTTPITVTPKEVVKAIAVLGGYLQSAVGSFGGVLTTHQWLRQRRES